MTRLTRDFFNRHVVEVAKDLLGKKLVFGDFSGIIVETEAYRGDDAASHAFRGPSPRTEVMFGLPGRSYVYLIYGMYHCLNIVSEPEGTGAGVLIRGLILEGDKPGEVIVLDGPGKICRHLGIRRSHTGLDCVIDENFCVLDAPKVEDFLMTPRIGITKNKDVLWRFVIPSYENTLRKRNKSLKRKDQV